MCRNSISSNKPTILRATSVMLGRKLLWSDTRSSFTSLDLTSMRGRILARKLGDFLFFSSKRQKIRSGAETETWRYFFPSHDILHWFCKRHSLNGLQWKSILIAQKCTNKLLGSTHLLLLFLAAVASP
jgi:hypothetical protein